MDHFAKPGDELAVAQRAGAPHARLPGLRERAAIATSSGLGISAIGKIGPTYVQNVKTLDEYYEHLDRGELPVLRGVELTADDLVRRAVIQALACHFTLSKESIDIAYLVDFDSYFAAEMQDLAELERRRPGAARPGLDPR